MLDELRRIALFSSGVAELTRHQAEQIVKDLVKAGDVRRKQASSVAKDLVDRSRENRKELVRFIRSEIQNQIAAVGVATNRDLERLERRVARLESAKSSAPKTTRKKTSAKKATKKTSAKKTMSSSSGAKSGTSGSEGS